MNAGQITLAILGSSALSAIIVAIIGAVTGKDTRRADAARDVADGASILVGPLSTQLSATQAQVASLQAQVAQMVAALDEATKQFAVVAEAVHPLAQLADLVVPIIAAEYPDLAKQMAAAAAVARRVVED